MGLGVLGLGSGRVCGTQGPLGRLCSSLELAAPRIVSQSSSHQVQTCIDANAAQHNSMRIQSLQCTKRVAFTDWACTCILGIPNGLILLCQEAAFRLINLIQSIPVNAGQPVSRTGSTEESPSRSSLCLARNAHRGWVDYDGVVGDVVNVDDDGVDIDVVDGDELLDDYVLDECGCID